MGGHPSPKMIGVSSLFYSLKGVLYTWVTALFMALHFQFSLKNSFRDRYRGGQGKAPEEKGAYLPQLVSTVVIRNYCDTVRNISPSLLLLGCIVQGSSSLSLTNKNLIGVWPYTTAYFVDVRNIKIKLATSTGRLHQ